jgi:hypothetical protein
MENMVATASPYLPEQSSGNSSNQTSGGRPETRLMMQNPVPIEEAFLLARYCIHREYKDSGSFSLIQVRT